MTFYVALQYFSLGRGTSATPPIGIPYGHWCPDASIVSVPRLWKSPTVYWPLCHRSITSAEYIACYPRAEDIDEPGPYINTPVTPTYHPCFITYKAIIHNQTSNHLTFLNLPLPRATMGSKEIQIEFTEEQVERYNSNGFKLCFSCGMGENTVFNVIAKADCKYLVMRLAAWYDW